MPLVAAPSPVLVLPRADPGPARGGSRGKRLPTPYARRVRLSGDLSQERVSPLLHERDAGRMGGPAAVPAPGRGAPPARKRLTRRSSVTSPGNVLRTRCRPRNNREILPKPAHGTPALQEYVAAGAEPASNLDPEGPLPHGG